MSLICRKCGSERIQCDLREHSVICRTCGQWADDEAWNIKFAVSKTVQPAAQAAADPEKEDHMTLEVSPGNIRRGGKNGKYLLCSGKENTCEKQAVKDGLCWACYYIKNGEIPHSYKQKSAKKANAGHGVTASERASLKGAATASSVAVKSGAAPASGGVVKFDESEAIKARLHRLVARLDIPDHRQSGNGMSGELRAHAISIPSLVAEQFDRITITLERRPANG